TRRLRGFLQDITDRRKSEEKLFHLAHYDGLTSLPNRVLVFDRLQQALRRARRSNAEVAALFIDLDMFKKVNDTLGHDAGDQVLIDAAARLTRLFREQDTVSRIGGDEFLVVVDEFRTIGDVIALASRVLEAFREPLYVEGREFVMTASIGIAVAPHDGSSAHDLMRNADTAMYHAKQSGRDAYQFFTRSMNEAVERQLSIEQALRGAVERDQLYLRYQPLVQLPDRRIVGAEALLRWHHPELGDVSPDEFIPIAEQSGQIDGLGRFVIHGVIRQAAAWRRELSPEFSVSINVSPRQFRDADIGEAIATELDRAGLGGDALEVEVTEGLLLPGRGDVQRGLDALRSRGVGLVMDDFGTGYASLRYLRDHPFSSLKIDRGFIRGLDTDERHRKLVVSALRLGEALGMKAVAEGVETE
ncbi:MAG: putative bifunctional diguanylate cyclase/phosphodiesterase, partial [Candidatus Wenzhouxiangella sp. M2_3B_020]